MKVHTTRSGAELFLAGLGICIVVAGFYALGFEAGSRNRGEQDDKKCASVEDRMIAENQDLQVELGQAHRTATGWAREAISLNDEVYAETLEIARLQKQRAILLPYMKSGELVIEGRKP